MGKVKDFVMNTNTGVYHTINHEWNIYNKDRRNTMEKVQQLEDGVFLKVVPLKGNPLKSINIYIVKSKGEALLIDTGFNTEEIRGEMEDYLHQLELDSSNTSLFLTHLHSDHTGLASYFSEKGFPIYMSDGDYAIMDEFRLKVGGRWDKLIAYAHMQGLDQDQLDIEEHPGFRYRPQTAFPYLSKNPGDTLKVGDFHFEIQDFSGHTPGMVGLYEPHRKILFSGDHILAKITPNITFWGFEYGDALGTYLTNLEKLKKLEIRQIYSSHRYLIQDVDQRIEELKQHHQIRLNEAVQTLERHGKCTVRDITVNMHWDISAKNFDEFPRSQKWFAAGEAHAHLEHLRAQGICDMEKDEQGVLHYFLV